MTEKVKSRDQNMILVKRLPDFERVVKLDSFKIPTGDSEDGCYGAEFLEELPDEVGTVFATQPSVIDEGMILLIIGVKPGMWHEFRRFLSSFAEEHHICFMHT